MTRRAVVVGAGLGGLASAVALTRRGWVVLVLERAARLEPVGAGISLWPNALRALGALGLAEAVRGRAAVSGATGVRRPDGRFVARSDVGTAVRERYGEPLVVVHRAELVDLLVGALGGAELRLGCPVRSVDLQPTPVLHTDAGELPADLLVAADGIRSTLRAAAFPGRAEPTYAGYTAWRLVVPALDPAVQAFETWGHGGERFAVLPLGADRWYCYATAARPAGERARDEADELRRRFGGWHQPIPSLLAGLAAADVLRQDVEYLDPALPALHHGPLAFVGDAAHAMTPDLGQGGCLALEDAVELAACVDAVPLPAGLARYTERRLPRTSAVAERSRRAGRLYQAPYPVRLAAARLMGLVPDRLLARGLAGVLDWAPPGAP